MQKIKLYLVFMLMGFVTLVACQVSKVAVNQEVIAVSLEEITYEGIIKPIIQNNCISCHSGRRPSGKLKLTTYQEVRFATEKGQLLNRINSRTAPMPRSGLMSKEKRLAIEQWAKEDFKERSEQLSGSTIIKPENDFILPTITPINISKEGFDFFNLMQGHWVGNMDIMGDEYKWFSFDYRPISAAHIHGIYEGGTMGNIFTSFFIADFKGTKTIMARNGGILNGIYRTSYFILDKVELSNRRQYFRLVDAYGGEDIMWMELEFVEDKLNFNSYTSHFGADGKPRPHMKFEGTKKHIEISNQVAQKLNYPQNKIEKDFPNGLPIPYWGDKYPTVTSASYIHQDSEEDLVLLGKMAGDPMPINEVPYVASLKVNIEQNKKIKDKDLIIYLSKEPLTDDNGKIIMEYGYIKQSLFDGVLSFPEIAPNETSFTFHYLHPANYYITIVADLNKDRYISEGDITSKSQKVLVNPETLEIVTIENITVGN